MKVRFSVLLMALVLAALPSLASAQSTVSDSVLAVTKSGASLLRVNVNGNVGIGTSAPDQKLSVIGNAAVSGKLVASDSVGTQSIAIGRVNPSPTANMLRLRSGSPLGDRFIVDSAGGLVAQGSLGIGIILTEGSGERMIWHPYRAAFRAGGVSGDQWNDPNMGFYSAAFGQNTQAEGNWSIATGHSSYTDQPYSVAMGFKAYANGIAAVALGYQATANAQYSVAIGRSVSAMGHSGAIVIGDGSTSTDSVLATQDNQFNVRASGGIRLFTTTAKTAGVLMQGFATGVTATASTPWTGCSSVIWLIAASNCAYLSNSGTWTNVSDVNRKHNFATISGEDVLGRLRRMPISLWTYKVDADNVRHLGPTAQDFKAAFGLNGDDDTHISTVDADGVALAAAKALEARTAEQQARIEAVERENKTLRSENAELRARLDKIEAALKH